MCIYVHIKPETVSRDILWERASEREVKNEADERTCKLECVQMYSKLVVKFVLETSHFQRVWRTSLRIDSSLLQQIAAWSSEVETYLCKNKTFWYATWRGFEVVAAGGVVKLITLKIPARLRLVLQLTVRTCKNLQILTRRIWWNSDGICIVDWCVEN